MALKRSLLVVVALLPGRPEAFNHHLSTRNRRRGIGRKSIRTELRFANNADHNDVSVVATKLRFANNAADNDDTINITTTTPQQQQHRRAARDEVEAIGIHIPSGLRRALIENAHDDTIRKRFWIVDNSGSMILGDGHSTLMDHGDHAKTCTRWDEVSETVFCHTRLAAALSAPTNFRLLNPPKNGRGPLLRGPQSFSVGYGLNGPRQATKDCRRANSIMLRNGPTGRTPLCASVREVRRDIVNMLPELEKRKSKACIVVATDGCNHDVHNAGLDMNEEERNRDLVGALESLRGLPVRLVVRLCTDYEPVVAFFNNLHESLPPEIDIDVLDDHVAEAEEVNEFNPWLNYALVLHRMREMGQDNHLINLLDERSFTRREVREFCALLFGSGDLLRRCDGDDDDDDWEGFLREVDLVQEKERKQYNPKTKSMTPWIDTGLLTTLIDEEARKPSTTGHG